MNGDILWWGYLHQNGTIQVKCWCGDPNDYTTDCEGNPFVIKVVPPFPAPTRKEATLVIIEKVEEFLPKGVCAGCLIESEINKKVVE